MSTLIKNERIEGDLDDLLGQSQRGQIIEICSAQSKQGCPDYKASLGGVYEFLEGKGIFCNGVLVFECPEPVWDQYKWYPYDGDEFIAVKGKKILWMHGGKIEEVFDQGPMNFEEHLIFTNTLLLSTKKSENLLLIEKKKKKAPPIHKRGVKFWTKEFWKKEFLEHILPLPVLDPTPHRLGHPDGPVFLKDGEFKIITSEGERLLHSATKTNYHFWNVCAQGVITQCEKHPGELCLNEDPSQGIFIGAPSSEDIFHTRTTCVFRVGHRLVLAGGELLGRTLTQNLAEHPNGIMMYDEETGLFSLLVVDPLEPKPKPQPTESYADEPPPT